MVIPIYNEEENIEKVITDTEKALKKYNFEIIVVDDGSVDQSSELIKDYNIKLIKNTKSIGYGLSILKGISYCSHNTVVTLDGDGSYDSFDIPHLIYPIINKEADMVIGTRFLSPIMTGKWSISFLDKLGNYFINLLFSLLYAKRHTDILSSFRAFNKKIINKDKYIHYNSKSIDIEVEITVNALSFGKVIERSVHYRPRVKDNYPKRALFDGMKIMLSVISHSLRL